MRVLFTFAVIAAFLGANAEAQTTSRYRCNYVASLGETRVEINFVDVQFGSRPQINAAASGVTAVINASTPGVWSGALPSSNRGAQRRIIWRVDSGGALTPFEVQFRANRQDADGTKRLHIEAGGRVLIRGAEFLGRNISYSATVSSERSLLDPSALIDVNVLRDVVTASSRQPLQVVLADRNSTTRIEFAQISLEGIQTTLATARNALSTSTAPSWCLAQ